MASTENPGKTVTATRNDAYTGFLAISFLAMVAGCVLLYLDYQNYEGKTPPKAPTIEVPGAQLKILPGTGGTAAPKPESKPDDGKKDATINIPPANALPALLPETVAGEPLNPAQPIQPVQAALPPAPATAPVVEIPVVPTPVNDPLPAGVTAAVPVSPIPVPDAQPSIPNTAPTISDAPPVPQPRFTPPM
jgi:hypothetical protein